MYCTHVTEKSERGIGPKGMNMRQSKNLMKLTMIVSSVLVSLILSGCGSSKKSNSSNVNGVYGPNTNGYYGNIYAIKPTQVVESIAVTAGFLATFVWFTKRQAQHSLNLGLCL